MVLNELHPFHFYLELLCGQQLLLFHCNAQGFIVMTDDCCKGNRIINLLRIEEGTCYSGDPLLRQILESKRFLLIDLNFNFFGIGINLGVHMRL